MDHATAITNSAAERYALNELPDEERESFEEHFFSCEICADDVRSIAIFVDNVKAVLRQPSEPRPLRSSEAARDEPRRSWFSWFRPPVALATGFASVFAVLFGYELTENRRLASPQLSAAVVLHEETRGAVPFFEAGKPINMVLAADEGAHTPVLSVEIRSATGALIRTITSKAPPPDTPIILDLPEPKLPPARYSVIVGNTKYPFEVR